MREHGVLRRCLLIYEEALRRMEAQQAAPLDVLSSTSRLLRHFIEDYHEKLEEEQIFPRFRKAGKLTELVAVLLQQHQAGRRITDQLLQLYKATALKGAADRQQAGALIRSFIRMYRPHAAREDTVLFPALAPLVGEKEYRELGERFEEKEHQILGAEGFEGAVAEVARLEQALGIADLAHFTPR